MQYNFGSGMLTVTPSGSNPTPVQVGTLQDVSLDTEFEIKELHGSYQLPVALALGKAKLGGSFKSGSFNGLFLNQFLSGSTIATGQIIGVPNEAATIPATPYTVTVTNGATFSADMGVYDVTSQKPMARVASGPATGQYSVNVSTGVYTFAAADTLHVVWISYAYTSASTGKTVTFTNQPMGTVTTFALTLYNRFGSKYSGVKLYAVALPKISLPFKNDDFTIIDGTFMGAADSSGNVLDAYTSE